MSENSPFLDDEDQPSTPGIKRYGPGVLLLASIGVFAVVAGTSSSKSSSSSSSSLSTLSTDELSNIQFDLSNEYTSIHGHPAKDYIWLKEGTLVEPGRLTNVALTGVPDRFSTSDLTTTCSAIHTSNSESISGKSGNVNCEMTFPKPGSFTVAITITHATLGELGVVERDVVSRYVRRDIRKLSSDDLANFMDSAKTLYSIDTDTGKGLYGPNYKGMEHYVTEHLTNSVPDKKHDYMHDGMGFLTQHISITNDFETALQVVNPSVALPYWDFTQDFTKIKKLAQDEGRAVDYADLWTLDVWGEDYFGSSAGSSLHTVTEGRWAYTQVPKVTTTTKNTLMANAYGFMRAPWNLQSSPYITRYHSLCEMSIGGIDSYDTNQWPDCKTHHSAVFDIDSYAEYVVYNAYTAHAGVHLLIGGSGGSGSSSCDTWSELIDLVGPKIVKAMKAKSFSVMRNVWRSDYCTDPSSHQCEDSVVDSDTSECKLQCKGCELDQFTSEQKSNLNYMWRHLITDLSDFQLEQLTRKVFCDSKILLGEQIEASSAVDISFWPIHPTMERLMQYKQLVKPFTDYTWDGSPYESMWNSECKWGLMYDTDCLGHAVNDMTMGEMTVLDTDSGTFVKKHLTNQQVVATSKPANTDQLPYVYDSFDYTHCEEEGIKFKAVPKSD